MKKLVSVLIIFLACWPCASKASPAIMMDKTDTIIGSQPLRLGSFTARILSGNRVELTWLTAETWTNVTHYEIERSFNNANYQVVGSVQQISSRPIDQLYHFTDQINSGSGIKQVYYRLKQVNRDGHIAYSHLLPVKLDENNVTLNVWPNPVKSSLNLSVVQSGAGWMTVQVFDMQGRKVIEKRQQAGKGMNLVTIEETVRLNAGVYSIRIETGDGTTAHSRFIKTN
jgi:hypothetical protein